VKHSIYIENSVSIQMRDGVSLRAGIYRPHDTKRHPAILMRGTYARARTQEFNFLNLIDIDT
jgi:predicted acyl esterase